MTMMSFFMLSCGSDDSKDDGSNNTTDVAVTSNVRQLGATYAYIDGYVNLNLITSSYSSQRIGVEISMKEEFTSTRRVESKSLEGNKLTIVIDTLSAQTKYYYRTFVKINDLYYYGEKRSFTTTDFNNITTTGDVSDITSTTAKIISKVDLASVPEKENYRIGIVYSANKEDLNTFVFNSYAYDDVPVSKYDTTPVIGPVAISYSLYGIKDNKFEVTLSRLQTDKTYYYCSFTRAGSKAKYGEIKSFKTKPNSQNFLATQGVFIINNGNVYNGIDGSLTFLDFKTEPFGVTQNAF